MYASKLDTFLMMISKITIANPENCSSYEVGEIVVCHPGITDVAKSIDTIVCRKYKRVANPARTKETSSKRCQSFALPLHPKLKIE
jgi:hypothetical protein